MVPLSTLATIEPSGGPDVVLPLNRLPRPSHGQFLRRATPAARPAPPWKRWPPSLPHSFATNGTGTTYQEKERGNEGPIFRRCALASAVVLFLAALV